jgi:hypothetical protein
MANYSVMRSQMLNNNVLIEFTECPVILTDPDMDDEEDEDDEDADIEVRTGWETRMSVQALVGKQGMEYTIFFQPDVVVSRMVLYGIILNLVEILDNVSPVQHNAYLTAAATGSISAKELHAANERMNLTAEIQEKITKLRKLVEQRKGGKKKHAPVSTPGKFFTLPPFP